MCLLARASDPAPGAGKSSHRSITTTGHSKPHLRQPDTQDTMDGMRKLVVVSQGVPTIYSSKVRDSSHIIAKLGATSADVVFVQAGSPEFASLLYNSNWVRGQASPLSDSTADDSPYLVFEGSFPPLATLVRNFKMRVGYQTEAISGQLRAASATIIQGDLAHHGTITLVNAVLNPEPFRATGIDPLKILLNVVPDKNTGPVLLSVVFNSSHPRVPEGYRQVGPARGGSPEHCIFYKAEQLEAQSSKAMYHGFGLVGILTQRVDLAGQAGGETGADASPGGVVPTELPADLPILSASAVPEQYRRAETAVPELFKSVDEATGLCFDINEDKDSAVRDIASTAIRLLTQMSSDALHWLATLKALLRDSTAYVDQ